MQFLEPGPQFSTIWFCIGFRDTWINAVIKLIALNVLSHGFLDRYLKEGKDGRTAVSI